jgi:hypothetical protein
VPRVGASPCRGAILFMLLTLARREAMWCGARAA